MIEITNFKLLNKGSLIAQFSVKMMKWGGLQIREITLFNNGNKKWLNMPSRQYEDGEGKKKYFPYLAYEERSIDDKFKAAIMAAVEEYMAKNVTERKVESSDEALPF